MGVYEDDWGVCRKDGGDGEIVVFGLLDSFLFQASDIMFHAIVHVLLTEALTPEKETQTHSVVLNLELYPRVAPNLQCGRTSSVH